VPGRGRRGAPGRGRQEGTGLEGLQGPVEAAAVVAEAGMAGSKEGVSQDSGYRVHNDGRHTRKAGSWSARKAMNCRLCGAVCWWKLAVGVLEGFTSGYAPVSSRLRYLK
jgi:hypothetical protein